MTMTVGNCCEIKFTLCCRTAHVLEIDNFRRFPCNLIIIHTMCCLVYALLENQIDCQPPELNWNDLFATDIAKAVEIN